MDIKTLHKRWEMFFRELDVDYCYEDEDIDIKNMTGVVDFYSKTIDVLLVVREVFDEEDIRFWNEMSDNHGSPICLLYGDPLTHRGLLICQAASEGNCGKSEFDCILYKRDGKLCFLCLNTDNLLFIKGSDHIFTLNTYDKNGISKNYVFDSETNTPNFPKSFYKAGLKARLDGVKKELF